jgi:hypothetical protein
VIPLLPSRRRRGSWPHLLLAGAVAAVAACRSQRAPPAFDNCRPQEISIRIEIGIDLAGTETLHGSGAFTKDFLTHKSGEPCEFSRSVSFQDVGKFLEASGYHVQRSGTRLEVTGGLDAAAGVTGGSDAAGGGQHVRLSIVYAGLVLEHDADRFDEETQELTWELVAGQPRAVRFVLQIA